LVRGPGGAAACLQTAAAGVTWLLWVIAAVAAAWRCAWVVTGAEAAADGKV
jgi:hypothetical protein